MLFTFLATVAACQSMASRPQLTRKGLTQRLATVEDLVSKLSSPTESRAALQAASGIVNEILAETGNATEHMSDDDAALLREVIDLIETSIYSSMDSAHQADVEALNAAQSAVAECNLDIVARQSAEGDLGSLQQQVTDKQTELDRLQGVVDEKTSANATEWQTFHDYMQVIGAAPSCPDFSLRTMPALDVYFEKSDYSTWFGAQQGAYDVAKDKYTTADAALQEAIVAYNIQLAVRDVQYCDYKNDLVSACASFDSCFGTTSAAFNELVPLATGRQEQRIENLKAGDTLIQQIKFLLADSDSREAPPSVLSRYTIAVPVLMAKEDCDLTVLDDAKWVPFPDCTDEGAGPGKL